MSLTEVFNNTIGQISNFHQLSIGSQRAAVKDLYEHFAGGCLYATREKLLNDVYFFCLFCSKSIELYEDKCDINEAFRSIMNGNGGPLAVPLFSLLPLTLDDKTAVIDLIFERISGVTLGPKHIKSMRAALTRLAPFATDFSRACDILDSLVEYPPPVTSMG